MPKEPSSFKYLMRMMRGQVGRVGIGNTPEDGFFALQSRAAEYIDELLAEFQVEQAPGMRFWLLELIAEAQSPKAFPTLVECLRGEEADLWVWAIDGLQKLNTREARKALWEARSYTKATPEATAHFKARLPLE
ncbi:MAG: HEAT repeat domain-containing protein [Chloroflexota bacterium]|nr:HEAT repeat domain-containing protein [Chloroflexota bacterium]MDQ5867636.1 HEAT repeat domain-containing protein [Chloroflexota bacterium]